ncbi:MAG: tetratricopeptide repeat protein, partial [Gemmatimonadetes bacterium]|nr:tetratricopeptide repeat protein [Gemmatimonadota bacterium]
MNISSVKEILAAAERDAAAGRIDQSIARLKKALPRHRRSGRLPYQLGVFYFRQGQYPEAIESFQQALKCRLNTAEVQTSLGAALAASGRHEEAQKALRKAL